jgi:prevent-host-death family protein
MPISVTEDIRSVSELKRDTRKIFRHLHETGRPMVVTVKGKPDVVLLDAAVYERRLAEINLEALSGRRGGHQGRKGQAGKGGHKGHQTACRPIKFR